MKKFLTALLLSISLFASAQNETHDFITYDTIYQESGGQRWALRITRPRNMFTPNHPDTARRPAIIMMPGQGESQGLTPADTNTVKANTRKFGPHYWLQNGWDGGIQMPTGRRFPIIITVVPTYINPRPPAFHALIQHILNTYRIKRNSVHGTGLSMGAFTWSKAICYEATAGAETFMKHVTSLAMMHGISNESFAPYNAWSRGWPAFGHWAKKYGGTFLGFEGATDNSRKLWQASQPINDSVPGAAYYSYVAEGAINGAGGNGGHCCWNTFYNPANTNWYPFAPYGPNIRYSTAIPNTLGTYQTGDNVFTWMYKQGDTTRVGSPGANLPPNVYAGADQVITLPSTTVTLSSNITDEGVTTKLWTKISGPGATIVSPTAQNTDVNALEQGVYVFRITATDAQGLSTSDDVQVTVNPAENVAPVVSAGADITIIFPVNSVDINGSATDQDGTVMSYTWTKNSGPSEFRIESANSSATAITGLVPGTYVFTLTAIDDRGGIGSDAVVVIVNPATGSDYTPRQTAGFGEYQAYWIDSLGHWWANGNLSNLGTNGVGLLGRPERVLVSPFDLRFRSAHGGLHGGAAIDEYGYVWVVGDNDQGQHGRGDLLHPYLLPRRIDVDSTGAPFNNVRDVIGVYSTATASNGFYAIKNDGSLWFWGRGLGGFALNGTDNTRADSFMLRPTRISTPGNRLVKEVAAGQMVIVLMTDGTVWTAASPSSNNLGYAAAAGDYMNLKQLTTLSDIVHIAGGGSFNLALHDDGRLFGWGHSSNFLGDQTYPTGGGLAYPTPRELPHITNALPDPIKKMVTTYTSVHFLTERGMLFGIGDAAPGGIGNGETIDYANIPTPYSYPGFSAIQKWIKTPVQIGPGLTFQDVYGGMVYNYYGGALTTEGQFLQWGRAKAAVLVTGVRLPNGTFESQKQSAINRPWATPVYPFTIDTVYISTSPDCITNPTSGVCSTYVIPANTKPVVNAGSNVTISSTSYTLQGSATDNVFVSYWLWKKVSGPQEGVIDLPAAQRPTVRGLVAGTYVFRLIATDNGWLSDSAQVTITVTGGATNQPPTANAGADRSVQLPTTLTLIGAATDTDGTITAYSWAKVSGGSATITSATSASTTVTDLVPGVYTFRLTVTDNNGATHSDTVQITILAASPTPVLKDFIRMKSGGY